MERPTAEELAAMREDDKRYGYPLTIFAEYPLKLASDRRKLLAEIDALQAENATMRTEADRLANENGELKAELRDCRTATGDEGEADSTFAAVRQLRDDHDALESERDLLANENGRLTAKIERLRTMSTAEMMCENESVNAHVIEWEDRTLKAEARLKAATEALKKLANEASSLKEEKFMEYTITVYRPDGSSYTHAGITDWEYKDGQLRYTIDNQVFRTNMPYVMVGKRA